MAQLTLLRARRVYPAEGDVIEDGAILIDGDTIRDVAPTADLPRPSDQDVREVDYGDATILPGLIDVHTHPSSPGPSGPATGEERVNEPETILVLHAARHVRVMLESGVTTARDMGAKGSVAFAMKEGLERGLVLGPRMLVAGRPVTMTGGHMYFYGGEADGPDEVRRAVRTLFKEGADYIKVAATGGGTRISHRFRPALSVPELSVVADEAHALGRLTAAHASNSQGIANCLDAGIDLMAHCYFYEPDGTYRFRPELADRLAASAFVNPTLYLRQAEIDAAERRRDSQGNLSARDQSRLAYSSRSLDERLDGVRRMADAGVRIVAGSDSPFKVYPAGQFVLEISMLTRAGFSNARALQAATAVAAEAVGLGDRIGRLRPGMLADVLVVNGNPLQDLAALWNVVDVYAGGHRIERHGEGATPAPTMSAPARPAAVGAAT